jgi:hypothetical protein
MSLMDDPRLNDLNTTNYRIVVAVRTGVCAFLVLGAVFVFEVLRGQTMMAQYIMDSTLTAIVILSGVSAAQYGIKRFSDKGYRQAGAKQVITTEGGPVVAQPGGTLQSSDEGGS